MKSKLFKTIISIFMVMSMMAVPVSAARGDDMVIQPYYSNISSAQIYITFDMSNVVYCGLSLTEYAHGSGVSGIMKLFNSNGNCIAAWSVSDYESPYAVENTYQGVYGETYTVTFEGYAYSNNQTAPDRLELSVTARCED